MGHTNRLDPESPTATQSKESPGASERAAEKGAAVVVTQATHNDIPEICALYKRVWDEYRGKITEELLKAWQPSPLEFTSWMEGVTYFTARRDRKLIGVLGGSMSDGSVRLLHLAVDPEARRLGVGLSLATASVDWAKRSSASSIWIEALTRFEPAINLFLKLGFHESGVLHKHFWKEDVRILEKVL